MICTLPIDRKFRLDHTSGRDVSDGRTTVSPNAGGDAEALTALLRDLHAELGDFSYEWLAACAVYPGLHWHLTVYLGAVLAKAQNAPIPDENAHLAIARLPWFRNGSMPDDLRLRLIRGLEPECRETVRQAIKQLFYQAMVQPVDARDRTFEIDFARTPPPGWPYALRWLRAKAAPDAPVHDAIFVNYMVGRKLRPIDLRLDRALVTLFRARLSWSIRLLDQLRPGSLQPFLRLSRFARREVHTLRHILIRARQVIAGLLNLLAMVIPIAGTIVLIVGIIAVIIAVVFWFGRGPLSWLLDTVLPIWVNLQSPHGP